MVRRGTRWNSRARVHTALLVAACCTCHKCCSFHAWKYCFLADNGFDANKSAVEPGRLSPRCVFAKQSSSRALSSIPTSTSSIIASHGSNRISSRLQSSERPADAEIDKGRGEAGENVSFRIKIAGGATFARENFFGILLDTVRFAVPAGILVAGLLPLLAYGVVSPSAGASVSRCIAAVMAALATLPEYFFLPPIRLVSYAVDFVTASVVMAFCCYAALQAAVIVDVETGQAKLITALLYLVRNRREILSEPPAAGRTVFPPEAVLTIDNAGQDPLKKVLFRRFDQILFAPIREEVIFRGIMQRCFQWVENYVALRRKQTKLGQMLEERGDDYRNEVDSSSPTAALSRLWTFTKSTHSPSVLMTGLVFGLFHVNNWKHPLNTAARGRVKVGRELDYIRHVMVFVLASTAQFTASLLGSLRVLSPAYETYGLTGSIGAHMMWNFLVPIMVPISVVRIVVRLVRACYRWVAEKRFEAL